MKLSRLAALVAWAGLNAKSAAAPPTVAPPAKPEFPQDAQTAMKSFKFDAGLRVELFAAEPLLRNPVAFYPDEKGRWYIAETNRQEKGVEDNRAHNNWLDEDIAARTVEERLAMINKFYPDPKKFAEKFTKEEERIVRIEDSDADGVADKQTIFADGFREALDGTGAGLIVRAADVWWTCIPHLWRLRDADGDGKADVRERLLSGFGVKYAFRGHDMHGLRFGPDGKLYFSIGDRGVNVRSREGIQFSEPDTGCVMRCNADGTNFEIFAIGLRNPQELAFNEFGDLFTVDNNSDGGDQARFVHLVEGGDSGWRMTYQYLADRGPWNRERLWDAAEASKARHLVPPIANLGSGPSGFTYNPGTGLSEKYMGRFFLSDFRGGASASVIHEIRLEPSGATFKAASREFLKGVLSTDVEFGSDGSLYVLDWVEGWSGANKGRIYKLTDSAANAALQAQTRKLINDGMSKRADAELAQLLAHPDMRVRMSAQFALAEKGIGAAGLLTSIAATKGANVLARLHAIWALGQIAEKNPEAAAPLLPLLGDENAEVRAQAAKAAGDRKVAAAAEQMTGLLKDPVARVRFFAALGLAKLAHKPGFDAVTAALAENNDSDPMLRHAYVLALTSCATAEQLAEKVGDHSVAVRTGALLALRRQRNARISKFLEDQDESVLLETARAIHDTPIVDALPALAAAVANKNIKNPHILSRAINANYRVGKAENARALTAFAVDSTRPETARREALNALADWANPDAKDRLLYLWRPLPTRGGEDAVAAVSAAVPAILKEAPGSVQEAAARLCAKLSIAGASDALLQLVANEKANNAARVAAIHALGSLKDGRLSQAAKAAASATDARVRNEGLRALAAQEPAAAAKLIAEIMQSDSISAKQGALPTLAQIKTPEGIALLVGAMDQLLAGKIPAEIELDVYEAAQKADAPEIKERLTAYRLLLSKGDELTPYKMALVGGDMERGRRIFREKAEVQCLRCHKCEIGDSVVGPDLTHIGAQKERSYLLESIVLPNKKIADGFQIVTVTLKDNNVLAGRIVGEDAGALKLETFDDQGKTKTVSVPISSIAQRASAPSPMPENLRDFLTRTELRDLVEYLATRK